MFLKAVGESLMVQAPQPPERRKPSVGPAVREEGEEILDGIS